MSEASSDTLLDLVEVSAAKSDLALPPSLGSEGDSTLLLQWLPVATQLTPLRPQKREAGTTEQLSSGCILVLDLSSTPITSQFNVATMLSYAPSVVSSRYNLNQNKTPTIDQIVLISSKG